MPVVPEHSLQKNIAVSGSGTCRQRRRRREEASNCCPVQAGTDNNQRMPNDIVEWQTALLQTVVVSAL